MRKTIKWEPEEIEYLKIRCENQEHLRDYYVEFNRWRAIELFKKHPDPNYKIKRSYKSIVDQITRTLGFKMSDFKAIDATSTIQDLENADDIEYVDSERKITALREAASQQRRKYNQLIREISFQDRILEVIIKYMQRLDPVPSPEYQRITKDITLEEVLLLLSDTHIGDVVDFDEMRGINEYNFEVFKARLEYLAMKIIDICSNKLLGYKFDTLNIAMLGDMVCGIIHEELVENAEGTVIEWCFGGAIIIAQFLQHLAQHFRQINVHGVVGNHGRMKKKPSFKKRYVNWDYILYQILAIMLVRQPNITFNFPKSFFIHTEINKNQFCFMHGDNIRSWMGVPFYGINRMISNFTELMASKGDYIDYYCLGHFHQLGILDKVRGEKIINGSVKGGDEYTLGSFFTSSNPIQLMAGIHHEMGLTWRYPLNLMYADSKKKCLYEYDVEKQLVDQFREILLSM